MTCPKCSTLLQIDRGFLLDRQGKQARYVCVAGHSIYDPPPNPNPVSLLCEDHGESKPCLRCVAKRSRQQRACCACGEFFDRGFTRRVYCPSCSQCGVCKSRRGGGTHLKWCPRQKGIAPKIGQTALA